MNQALVDLVTMWRLITVRWGVYALMIGGLVMAYGATIVIGLYVRDELTYDRFLPGAEDTYLISARYGPRGQPLVSSDMTPANTGRLAGAERGVVEAVTRLTPVEWPIYTPRRKVKERFYWADANVFDVLQLPALYGDLATALKEPGSLVMTARMARLYFGRDDVIGRTLTTRDNNLFHVTAVLRDLPPNTHLDREIFAAGNADYALLSVLDRHPDYLWAICYSYARLRPDASANAAATTLARLTHEHWVGPQNIPVGFDLIPLVNLHFQPHGDGEMKPRGHLNSLLALESVALAILTLAGINFSSLILAETSERAAEMAVRMSLGARRLDLIFDLFKEALVINVVSMGLALAFTERLLPILNTLLDLDMVMWTAPLSLLGLCAATALLVAMCASLYPALLISRPFGHASQTRTEKTAARSLRWRGTIVAQMTLVIVLLIASQTMVQQWRYATRDSLKFAGDHVLMIRSSDDEAQNVRFKTDVLRLPGVTAAAESWGSPRIDYLRPALAARSDGQLIALTRHSVHPDFFAVYGVRLLAGRNLSDTFVVPETPKEILINAAAVKALGFLSPAQAVGKVLTYDTDRTRMKSKIVGIAPDLRFTTVYEPVQPMIFDTYARYFTQLNVRLDPKSEQNTLRQIDAVWERDVEGTVPVDRHFFREYLTQQYHDLNQQIRVFALVAIVGILLSTLGLTGLSIFLTRHQMREIAIRRALGASFQDILLERLTPFLAPLCLANLIGWPVAAAALTVWLNSFAEHASLSLLSFVAAGALSAFFTLFTLAIYSMLTIKDVPLRILRHR